ncbi:hypothetical protein ACP70R_002488 [Stipagrostis hirtigluma subsp. patula]
MDGRTRKLLGAVCSGIDELQQRISKDSEKPEDNMQGGRMAADGSICKHDGGQRGGATPKLMWDGSLSSLMMMEQRSFNKLILADSSKMSHDVWRCGRSDAMELNSSFVNVVLGVEQVQGSIQGE